MLISVNSFALPSIRETSLLTMLENTTQHPSLTPNCPKVDYTLFHLQQDVKQFITKGLTHDKVFSIYITNIYITVLFNRRDDTLFTGIIEEVGTVTSIQRKPHALEMTIRAKTVLDDVKRGDSISVNGVCLTVSSFTNETFIVDVIPETFKSTTLAGLSSMSSVNLERAMAANGRFGGHFVSGHVDGMGVIRSIKKETNAVTKKIELDARLMKYMMVKGSVAVDGTSLTIFDMDRSSITISLIPTTQYDSLIGNKGIGEKVNIECDMLAKYTERMQTSKSNMSKEWLQEQGF